MKLLSKACEYGIRAVLRVASIEGKHEYVPVREIAGHLNISVTFLAKIVQTLTQANILVSHRGPNGGIALAKPANQISLMDVVTIIDGDGLFNECLLGLPDCGEGKPCPFHQWWQDVRGEITGTFSDTTVADLRDDIKALDLRIVS